MSNFLSQFFLKRVFKGPSIHFVKPKVLNIRFPGNQMPNYTFLNLEEIFTATPELKKNDDNTFSLFLNVVNKNDTERKIQIGLFKNEKQAKEAYVKTISAFFSPSHSVIKIFVAIGIIAFSLQLATTYVINMGSYIASKNQELMLKAELENEKAKLAENLMLQQSQRAGKQLTTEDLQKILKPEDVARIIQANQISPQVNNAPQQSPVQKEPEITLPTEDSFSEVHNDLAKEIQDVRNRQIITNTKPPSAGDILLKELKGN